MTTANKITILRILLVPFFIVQVIYFVQEGNHLFRFLAVLSFALAACSDGVDGYIARRYNQKSELGALLDPLADKLLLVSGVLLLSLDNAPYFERIPLWMTATIIGRDVILLLGHIVIQMTVGKVKISPRITGKLATVLQMVVVFWILLQWHSEMLDVLVLGATLFTAVSGLLYVADGIHQLSVSPSSSPTLKK